MEDLEHILPEQIRRNLSGRRLFIGVLVGLGIFVALTIILGSLLAHKHVETRKQAGGLTGNPSAQTSQGNKGGPGTCVTPSCLQAAAWSLTTMDKSVNPCDNFYEYACGGWEKNKVIPPDWMSYTVNTELHHENEEKLREIIQSPIRRNAIQSTERKLKDFFQSCLHDYGRMQEGASIMLDIIKNKLGGWYALDPDNWQSDQWDMTAAMTTALGDYLINAFFTVGVAPDRRNYSSNVITINWFSIIKEYFGDEVTQDTEVCLRRKGFFDMIDEILTNETDNKNRIMNNYLVWSFVDTYAHHLSWEYKYTGLKFSEVYSGRPIDVAPTWEQCLSTTEFRLGSALAAEFLAAHLGQGGKDEVEAMFESLRDSLQEQLEDVVWMDNVTKARAQEKLSKLGSMIGFPKSYFNQTFLDQLHRNLVINKTAGYFTNFLNTNAFLKKMWQLELKAGRELYLWRYVLNGRGFGIYPRHFWYANKVLVPAGVMQFPVFNRQRPKYMGYGGLGSLVGEQMYNSVNDMGRYVWHNGTYWVWWTTQSYAEHLKQKACFTAYLVNQQSGPYLVDGVNITLPLSVYAGRSIMNDYVGIKLAYKTYMKKFKDTGSDPTPPGLGLTSEQAFFLSTAQIKCAKRRDGYAYSRVRAGYTPDDLSVNVALGHMQEFNDAFKCSAQDPMNLKEKCHYWPSK